MPKKKSDKWSIQISSHLADILKEFCQSHGYTMSGFTQIAIVSAISGSTHIKT